MLGWKDLKTLLSKQDKQNGNLITMVHALTNTGLLRRKRNSRYRRIVWSPAQLSQVTAWYDLQDNSTMYEDSAKTIPVVDDGAEIGAIENKLSPGTYDMLQAGGSTLKPTWRFDGGGHVETDADDSFSQITAWPSTSTPKSIAICFRQTTSTTADIYTMGSNSARMECRTNDTMRYRNDSGANPVVITGSENDTLNVPHSLIITTSGVANCNVYLDGSFTNTFDPNDVIFNQNTWKWPTHNQSSIIGNFTQIVLTAAVLTPAEIWTLTHWFNSKLPPA